MRIKKIYTVLSFRTTTDAMEAEELNHKLNLSGRLIPLPTQLSAGCGLALRISPEDFCIFSNNCSHELWESSAELIL